MRPAEEMDQADVELRETILKVWPFTAREKINLLVPAIQGETILAFVNWYLVNEPKDLKVIFLNKYKRNMTSSHKLSTTDFK